MIYFSWYEIKGVDERTRLRRELPASIRQLSSDRILRIFAGGNDVITLPSFSRRSFFTVWDISSKHRTLCIRLLSDWIEKSLRRHQRFVTHTPRGPGVRSPCGGTGLICITG